MIRRFIIFALLIVTSFRVGAQIYDPVSWDFSYEKKGDKQYEIIFTATIEEHSHIYSMDIPDGGPIPTSFQFDTIADYKLDGKTYEVTSPVELLDEAFGFKIKTFSTKAEFRQKITSVESSFTVKGIVNFMACNNATCSPPKDVEFAIEISEKTKSKPIVANGPDDAESGPVRSDR